MSIVEGLPGSIFTCSTRLHPLHRQSQVHRVLSRQVLSEQQALLQAQFQFHNQVQHRPLPFRRRLRLRQTRLQPDLKLSQILQDGTIWVAGPRPQTPVP